jgi:hypothetical protein
MDVSWVISLLLGLPVAALTILKIIDWCRKRSACGMADNHDEQRTGDSMRAEEQPSPAEPAEQAMAQIIRQAELAAAVDI